MSSNQQTEHADIAIVGAGVGGCIAALALAPHYSVALIDQEVRPQLRVGECLAPATTRIFKKLDLMSLYNSDHHIVSHGMISYWGSHTPQILDNLRNPDGLGLHINRQWLESSLRDIAKQRGVHCYWGKRLHSSNSNDNEWQLNLESTDQHRASVKLKAHIVIDAAGRRSPFTHQRGITRTILDKLVSCWLCFNVTDAQPLGVICPEEHGWWYSAPMPANTETGKEQNRRILSLQTDSDLLDSTVTKSPDKLIELANNLTGLKDALGNIETRSISLQSTVAANSSRLNQCAGAGWFAIGDSAISLDPLSSQGMFNAMASAMQLSDLLIERGIDNPQNIKDYTQQIDRIWQHYVRHKTHYYSQERRWAQAPFWSRRKEAHELSKHMFTRKEIIASS